MRELLKYLLVIYKKKLRFKSRKKKLQFKSCNVFMV